MEEWVGQWWHRAITRAADSRHADAAVTLASMARPIGLLFRAAGGDAAVRLAPAGDSAVGRAGGGRGWLQRLAGSGRQAALPLLQPEVLALPAELAVFPERALNRDLYLWLAALAAGFEADGDWLADNRAATARALQRFPGLRARHAALCRAQQAQRPAARPGTAEAAVQAALRGEPPPAGAPARVQPSEVAPVWLWLDAPATAADAGGAGRKDRGEPPAADAGPRPTVSDARRRRAERVDAGPERAPFMMFFRAESLLSWGDFVRVNRATDDEPDDQAVAVADDLQRISLAADGQASASRVKFDLDLPSAAADDLPLGPGVRLPEWDWKRGTLRPDHCAAQLRVARPGEPFQPTPALRATARRVRRRLEGLRAAPAWQRGLAQGEAIDLDAFVRHAAGRAAAGVHAADPPVYALRGRSARSLATLLLADLSLSTDAWVPATPGAAGAAGQDRQVIAVIRDALYVFGEALAAGGDAFEMLGFSSVRREVRIQHLKGFDEAWGPAARDRVGAIKPGFYTRMGAAIRFATQRLAARPERQRLLLLLTDGKPNDLDAYEGRHGLEDTRHAVQAARAAGLLPFCLTIDADAHDYLPMLFGQQGYALVPRPGELVARLAQVHALLAR